MIPPDKTDNFEDYFDEFDSLYSFDDEVCPTCGAKNFDSCEFSQDNFVLFCTSKSFENAEQISNALTKENITNQLIFENISPPLWNIMVMYKDQRKALTLIKNPNL